ncbi:MAG: serine hydrolase [Thermoprotei archaeon]|nr:MAG: serine hydrolase [Thermoprotei archaeon]
MTDDVLKDIESFILKKVSKTKIPSVSVSVVDRDGEVWSRAYGFRDLERGLPAKTTTLYGVGSVTKSFTCLSVMLLQEEGKLSVDDPVEKHLPLELRVKGESVRIWHLMTHSSGIPALAYAEALIRGVVGEENSWISISDCDDMYAFLRKAGEWGEFRPGEKHFYLNEGYVLLGCIVERVSGKSFVDFVHERVLQPLGMSRSYFRREDVESDGDYAVPYVIPEGGKPQPSSYPWGIAADGGLISNVHDLGRYLRMYLNKGVLDGREVVPRRVVEGMVKPRIPVSGRVFGDEKYGFGWFITERFHGERLVFHGGSVLVYTAWVGFLPDRGLGVVLLANASGYLLSYLGMDVLSLLIREES